jgi:hypothetical protein
MLSNPSKPHREITDLRERVAVGVGLAKRLVRIVDWAPGRREAALRERRPREMRGNGPKPPRCGPGSQLAGGSVKPGAS